MSEPDKSMTGLLASLQERAKELNCLYQVEELLRDVQSPLEKILSDVAKVARSGWFDPERCQVKIIHEGKTYRTDGFVEGKPSLIAPIRVQDKEVGRIQVSYREDMPVLDDGPFLREEKRLICAIAERLGQTILHRNVMPIFEQLRESKKADSQYNWRMVLDVLRITDQDLFQRISRRMLNYLCYIGVEDAGRLLDRLGGEWHRSTLESEHEGLNRPGRKRTLEISLQDSDEILTLASRHLSDETVFSYLQKWIKESKVSFLIDVLEDHSSSLSDVVDAINRYKLAEIGEDELSPSTRNAARVSLIRRFFSRRLEVIQLTRDLVSLSDFHDLSRRLVFPDRSKGHLGGKSAGLFIAMRIVEKVSRQHEDLADIRVPKTWYVASDGVQDFIHHNHLEELLEYKYRDIDQIRMEYPNLVQLFKNCSFSPELVKGLALALDDFGDRPLIVRSSSLLEDSIGAAFSGKYKSLFIANQGTKTERLASLLDAMAEVYASTFAPDPIQYRRERGLLDFQEEMGVMIQEVVGERVGRYVFPAFGGVAFSNNEFRWSPRIKREDGLIRMVPGLGTRAVDRVGDDYTVLIAPGRPGLRVNASIEEVVHYSPRHMDAINLETRSIETIPLRDVLAECGSGFPRFRHVFSVLREGLLTEPGVLEEVAPDRLVATFEGLRTQTPFVRKVRTLLEVLEQHFGFPVDIEFAGDGRHFFLLQCRSQSSGARRVTASIPRGLPPEDTVFTAERHVSDGYLPNLTHVAYVVPSQYSAIDDLGRLKEVGRVVSRLNRLLPKRQFILMGPGRWGSRGDIRLGVEVSYSDINNTAALVEIAFRKGNYVPDLSFGTHFFQDLVEASILYLPLYPDDPGVVFNRRFLEGAPNILEELLPDAGPLSHVVRVIDVQRAAGGRMLQLVMNADEGKAVAFLQQAGELQVKSESAEPAPPDRRPPGADEHWIWRQRMAEKIASSVDPARFGVKAAYLFGSTKNAAAGPCSDIDMLFHFEGTLEQRNSLVAWLEGWGRCLAEINYLRTGCHATSLLDFHLITDEDIQRRTSYAVKIGTVSDAARPLPLGPAA